MNLIQIINTFFKTNFKTCLELYIESKRPTSVADIERAQQEYFTKISKGHFAS